jgi:thiamine-monophosphate kinase
MLSEFDLIARFFQRDQAPPAQVALGIGDDCALLTPAVGMQLAISTDMLLEGRHFFPQVDPQTLGHKALAVNLSDLAAMGARPLAFTLSLALPSVEEDWLAAFARGLFALADQQQCPLIGGDTTRGPLNICVTVFGEVPPGLALRRDAAQDGDDIWVSGAVGDARLALASKLDEIELDGASLAQALPRLQMPTPRVQLGLALRGVANAAIDLSDGLCGDLGHILKRSNLGATLNADALPVGPALARQAEGHRRAYALAGGDDYELCFTAPVAKRAQVEAAGAASATPVTRVGSMESKPGLRLTDGQGRALSLAVRAFDHFRP